MKRTAASILLAAFAATSLSTAQAEPGGCLKYGAAGALGGHLVHHGVLGAAGGCVAGMVRRHEYRKGVREKAALYDKEHPADPKQSWWQRHHNALSDQQKSDLWDKEHPAAQNGAVATPPAQ